MLLFYKYTTWIFTLYIWWGKIRQLESFHYMVNKYIQLYTWWDLIFKCKYIIISKINISNKNITQKVLNGGKHNFGNIEKVEQISKESKQKVKTLTK